MKHRRHKEENCNKKVIQYRGQSEKGLFLTGIKEEGKDRRQ
jgi:hypothetical protein